MASPALNRPAAVIVDIDGTLAIHVDRSPYDETRVLTDEPNALVISNVRAAAEQGFRIIITSGRTEGCRADTETWLKQHLGVEFDALHMRAVGGARNDAEVKEEFYRDRIAPHYFVQGVFDDRNRVVARWRELGLLVFQVAFLDR